MKKFLCSGYYSWGSEWTPGARQRNIFNVPRWGLTTADHVSATCQAGYFHRTSYNPNSGCSQNNRPGCLFHRAWTTVTPCFTVRLISSPKSSCPTGHRHMVISKVHWLCVQHCGDFKLAALVYSCLHSLVQTYWCISLRSVSQWHWTRSTIAYFQLRWTLDW